MTSRRAYLDHAATTPIRADVIDAMTAAMSSVGNPSSLHTSGRRARKLVEESRERVAVALGARPSDVVFTSGGTEADNLAVKGLYWARRAADPRRVRILASTVEHHAVLDAVEWLAAEQGAKVDWVPVDRNGRLDVDALRAAVSADAESVALITVMWANNEVGTLQPIGEVVAVARQHGIPVHSDAVQAVGQVPVDFAASGLDALTVSGHKLGGPVGSGALLLRRECELVPLTHGGGQERDVRSGTLDPAGIAGISVAVAAAADDQAEHATRLAGLRDELVAGLLSTAPRAVRNGDPVRCVPHIAHLSFPGCEGDSLLLLLDAAGIDCSTGSACTAGVPQASHVLTAMGVDPEAARGSLRFSLGRTTTPEDVAAAVRAIGPAVERARAAGLVNRPARGGV